MKKILSLLLICCTLLSLAACSTTPDNLGSKKMNPPEMTLSMKNADVSLPDGTTVKDVLVESPMNSTSHNPESTKTALQNLSWTKKWHTVESYTEATYPYTVNDRQYMAYRYATNITLNEAAPSTTVAGNQIAVSYITDTDSVIGYAAITVTLRNGEFQAMTMEQMQEVMRTIYGKEYADFLMNAKMTANEDGIESYEVKQGDATVFFMRNTSRDDRVMFAIEVVNNANNQVDGNGAGFVSKNTEWNVICDFFGWNQRDLSNLKTIGTDFITEHYGANAYLSVPDLLTTLSDSPILYQSSANMSETALSLAVYTNDKTRLFPVTLASTTNKDGIEVFARFDFDAFAKSELTDERRDACNEKAVAIAKSIIGQDVTVDDVNTGATFTVTKLGKTFEVSFLIELFEDEAGNYRVWVTMNAITQAQ